MDNDVKKAGYGLAEFLILSVICLFIAFETVQLLLPQLFLLTRFLWQSEYTMTAFVCLVIILAMAEFRLFKWIQKMLHQILYKYDKKKRMIQMVFPGLQKMVHSGSLRLYSCCFRLC